MLKTLLVLFIILSLFSCKKNTSFRVVNDKEDKISKISPIIEDSLEIKDSVLSFLDLQKDILKNNDFKEFSEHVVFPLDGDVLYFMVYGDESVESSDNIFDIKIDREIFMDKHHMIFPRFYKEILCAINNEKELNDSSYSFVKRDKDSVLWEVNIEINYEENYFSISFDVITDNSEEEYSIYYKYLKTENKYMLSYIGATG